MGLRTSAVWGPGFCGLGCGVRFFAGGLGLAAGGPSYTLRHTGKQSKPRLLYATDPS